MVVGIGGGHIFLTVSVVVSTFLLTTFPAKILVYLHGLDGLESTTSCWVGLTEFWVWFTITGTCTVVRCSGPTLGANIVILFVATGLTDNCTTSTFVHNNRLFSSLQKFSCSININNIMSNSSIQYHKHC